MIAIIDYGMGNLGSVSKAFEYVGAEVKRTDSKSDLQNADALVLPGVGAFPAAMKNLDALGLIPVIQDEVRKGKPFLGICLGYQLLFDKSYEMEECEGLALARGEVKKFEVNLKIPHIGWNEVRVEKKSPLSKGIRTGEHFYFVHSYYVEPQEEADVLFTTEYGISFAAAIAKGNVFGTQFHPEKSQEKGLQMIKNFKDFVCK